MKQKRNTLIIECHKLGLGHSEIAADFGISRERVRQIVKRELGTSTPLRLTTPSKRKVAMDTLLSLESGRSVENVAFDQDITSRRLSDVLVRYTGTGIRQLAFQVWMSRQIGQQLGYWRILSIKPGSAGSQSQARCKATAQCLLCSTTHEVGYRSMADGTSRMCRSCGAKNRQNGIPLLAIEDGSFHSNIASASKTKGVPYFQLVKQSLKENSNFQRITPWKHCDSQGTSRKHFAR